MLTGIRKLKTLIHINIAIGPFESFLTLALVCITNRGTLGSIPAWLVCTIILFCTMLSSPTKWTCACVWVQRWKMTSSTISARARIAYIWHGCFTQRIRETHRARTCERRCLVCKLSHNAGSTILTLLFACITGISVLAVFSNIVRRAPAIWDTLSRE